MGMKRQKKIKWVSSVGVIKQMLRPTYSCKSSVWHHRIFSKAHLMKSASVSTFISTLSSFLLSFLSCFPEFFGDSFSPEKYVSSPQCTTWFFVVRVFDVWIYKPLIFVNVNFGCKRTSFFGRCFPLVVLALSFGSVTLSFADSFPLVAWAVL